jgi:hypothetical protein
MDILIGFAVLIGFALFVSVSIILLINWIYPFKFGERVLDWVADLSSYLGPPIILGCILALIYNMASCAYQGTKEVVKPSIEQGSFPFFVAGIVGFLLLFISVRAKHIVIGGLGAALVAAAFSHWVGPVNIKDFIR